MNDSLVLDYYSEKGFDGSSLKSYNKLFDRLNKYDSLKYLKIITDFIMDIPKNVSKFKNLKTLEIEGTRFCCLTMRNVPVSVEKLILTQQANLQPNCIKGMERLVNLKELEIVDIFGITEKDSDSGLCIPHIPGLKITFEGCFQKLWDDIPGWHENVLAHGLFRNVRIKSAIKDHWNIIVELV